MAEDTIVKFQIIMVTQRKTELDAIRELLNDGECIYQQAHIMWYEEKQSYQSIFAFPHLPTAFQQSFKQKGVYGCPQTI